MKIAIVSQPWEAICPPRTGSIEIQIYEAARRLAKSHEVLVYARSRRGKPRTERDEGVQYRRFRILHGHRLIGPFEDRVFRDRKRPFCASPLFYFSYAIQVARDLAEQKCDVIHVHNFHQIANLIKRFNPKSEVVLHMHCDWLGLMDRDMLLPRLRNLSGIIGCSEYISNNARRRFPKLAERCRTVYYGIDLCRFKPDGPVPRDAAAATRILFVGRVSPEKGIHVLIDAFRLVVRECPTAELDIIGPDLTPPAPMVAGMSDDPLSLEAQAMKPEGYRQRICAALPEEIRRRIRFHDTISNSELPSAYRGAGVFVFPSVWEEPFGIPVAEAMACGLPVVGTRSGGIAESIEHGQTGLLVERGDSQSLAQALTTLLLNSDLRESMGRNARERATRLFSWDRTVGDLVSFYESLTSQWLRP
jgi:glycosyltransferase involved in cell wall biosynthesis